MRFKSFQPGEGKRFYVSMFSKTLVVLTIWWDVLALESQDMSMTLWSLISLTCQP